MKYDYEREILIDPYQLDKEWQRQPSLYLKYADALAEARSEYDKKKEAFEIMKATLDIEIRESSDKKPTETAIQNMVLSHPAVMEALKDILEVKSRVNKLTAATSAFDQKKVALENLVRLHGQSYFSEPVADTTGREYLDEETSHNHKNKVRITRRYSAEEPNVSNRPKRASEER